MEPQQQKSGVGPIIGTVIIIALIILGGLYFWGKRVEESKATQNLVTGSVESTATVDQMEANAIKSVTPANDTTSIQADLNATNLDDLQPELNPQQQ